MKKQPQQIVLETTAVASGPRLLLNEKLVRVREDDKAYRKPKPGQTFESAMAWLMDTYRFDKIVRPKQYCGTVKIKRFYTKMNQAEIEAAQAERDAYYDAGIGYRR